MTQKTDRNPTTSKFRRFGRDVKNVKPEEPLDYKNITYLANYMSPQFRILSRKRTGFSGRYQRELTAAIKRARFLALLPYTA
ncbi:MAG TPA: 30S ribosomal protein S18 [Planctomycetota bacterium]|nr:30S ribosomal protein S18 [Planctomycetota bacterium]